MLYCIKSPEKLQLKEYIRKYIKDISISTNTLEGSFSITNIRFYTYNVEVDVVFKGKMYGRRGRKPSSWLSSNILNEKGVSKIRINRYIRKNLINKLNSRLAIFGVDTHHYSYIKKLKWI